MNDASTATILRKIETLQQIQKQEPPTSEKWQTISDMLAPLFAEMARRQAAGDPLAN